MAFVFLSESHALTTKVHGDFWENVFSHAFVYIPFAIGLHELLKKGRFPVDRKRAHLFHAELSSRASQHHLSCQRVPQNLNRLFVGQPGLN